MTDEDRYIDRNADDALENVIDRVALAGLSAPERFAVLAVAGGYSRRHVAELAGLTRRHVNEALAKAVLAHLGESVCQNRNLIR